jgi:hypothetical protein
LRIASISLRPKLELFQRIDFLNEFKKIEIKDLIDLSIDLRFISCFLGSKIEKRKKLHNIFFEVNERLFDRFDLASTNKT